MTYTPSPTGTRGAVTSAGQAGIPALVMRGDSDTITTNDGELSLLRVDEEGRVKVATKPASVVRQAGSLVSTAAAATGLVGGAVAGTGFIAFDVQRASNVVFHLRNTGSATMAAGTFVWEASIDSTTGLDGTWFGIQAVRSNANTVELQIATPGTVAGAGYAASWEASVNAYAWLRIRCSVNVTASSIATWTVQRGSYATEPIPAAQATATQAVSGTVTVALPTGTAYTLTTAATTNAAVVKASAGSVFEVTIANVTATAAYVKLYNKATAPTVGTDVPVLTIPAPAGATQVLNLGALGKRFAAGVAIAVTAAAAATDTGVTVAGIQVGATYI